MSGVLMILQTAFPPDIRVENEIESLTTAGIEVHLLAQNSGTQATTDTWQKAVIHRIPAWFGTSILGKLIQMPFFPNPVWLWYIYKITRLKNLRLLHVHDLPLTPMAIFFKWLLGLRIIYDMHENYPAALQVWNKQGLESIFKSYRLARLIERLAARSFDHFIAVIEENERRFINEYGIRPSQITVVSNLVVLTRYQPDFVYSDFVFPTKSKVLIYTGGLDLHRGLGLTLEMFRLIAMRRRNLFLLIVGGGRSSAGKVEEKRLRDEIAKDAHIGQRVHITGWVDFKYLPWLVQQSDVCLLPQESNTHTDTTIPHKLFQYMAMGKPVIAADAIPVKRIVQETGAGVVFHSGNAEDYAAAVEKVLADPAITRYGEMGVTAVMNRYNWEFAASNLLDLYHTAINAKSSVKSQS